MPGDGSGIGWSSTATYVVFAIGIFCSFDIDFLDVFFFPFFTFFPFDFLSAFKASSPDVPPAELLGLDWAAGPPVPVLSIVSPELAVVMGKVSCENSSSFLTGSWVCFDQLGPLSVPSAPGAGD